jgi:hypothetical protein
MALDKFKAPVLPDAPVVYDRQQFRQLIRSLEIYFSQLDAQIGNHASSYTADEFIGGVFSGLAILVDNLTANSVSAQALTTDTLKADDVVTDTLFAKTGVGQSFMADSFYGGTFYGDGSYLRVPFQRFASFTNQTAANTTTAYVITLDVAPFQTGITLVSGSRMTVAVGGVYRLEFEIQVNSTSAQTELADIWLRKNGVDIPDSNTKYSCAPKSGGQNSIFMAIQTFVGTLAANDYVEVVWHAYSTALSIQSYAATSGPPVVPRTPSAIIMMVLLQREAVPPVRVAPVSVSAAGRIGQVTVRATRG